VTSKRASQRYAVGARHASPESIHCAELLRDELNELGISLIRLARDTRILLSCVSLIVNGRRSITADTAMRLAHQFETSAQLWLNLQTASDLEVAQKKAAAIKREVILGFRVA
jgi:antitoxin HigA-1